MTTINEAITGVRRLLDGKHQVVDMGQQGWFRVYVAKRLSENERQRLAGKHGGTAGLNEFLRRIHPIAEYKFKRGTALLADDVLDSREVGQWFRAMSRRMERAGETRKSLVVVFDDKNKPILTEWRRLVGPGGRSISALASLVSGLVQEGLLEQEPEEEKPKAKDKEKEEPKNGKDKEEPEEEPEEPEEPDEPAEPPEDPHDKKPEPQVDPKSKFKFTKEDLQMYYDMQVATGADEPVALKAVREKFDYEKIEVNPMGELVIPDEIPNRKFPEPPPLPPEGGEESFDLPAAELADALHQQHETRAGAVGALLVHVQTNASEFNKADRIRLREAKEIVGTLYD